jgi:hypothetical protein
MISKLPHEPSEWLKRPGTHESNYWHRWRLRERFDVLSRRMDQGQRRPVTNCAMRSHFVVLGTPFFNLFAGVVGGAAVGSHH